MRKILFLICLLGTSGNLSAQRDLASWSNLHTLQAGKKIQVLALRSKVSGAFASVSEAAITVQQKAGLQTIQRQDVQSVRLMENKHRLRNTLILAGAGAGMGAGIGAALHKQCSSPSFCLDIGGRAVPAAIGAVLGGLGGAVVGVLLPSHSTIYQSSSH